MVPGFSPATSMRRTSDRAGPFGITGTLAHFVDALHAILRQLDLNLERLAGVRIAPVVRLRESRRRRGRHDGVDHVSHGQAELAGAVAVDANVQRGVVRLLRELQIAQEGAASPFRCGLSARRRSRPSGWCPARRPRWEWAIRSSSPGVTISPASKEICDPGKSRRRRCAQPLAQRLPRAARSGFQGDLNDALPAVRW